MASEIPNSNIVDAKIKDALTNHPTKKDVDDAVKSKQDALNASQTNAVNSGVTKELVSKLEGIEAGAEKNPDMSLYAKKTEIPEIPDMSKYALNADVEAEELRAMKAERDISLKVDSVGEEIKSLEEITDNKLDKTGIVTPSASATNAQVAAALATWSLIDAAKTLAESAKQDAEVAIMDTFDYYRLATMQIDALDAAKMPSYPFVEAELEDVYIEEMGEGTSLIKLSSHKIIHVDSSRATYEFLEPTWKDEPESETSRDLILVIDSKVGDTKMFYLENWIDIAYNDVEWIVYPRNGDRANVEVMPGYRNVFFITEVHPKRFVIARELLSLS